MSRSSMFKKALAMLSLFLSVNSWAKFDPSAIGLGFSASSIGSDPGFKLELISPYFINKYYAIHVQYGSYLSSLSGNSYRYESWGASVSSRFYTTDFSSVYWKSGFFMIGPNSLSSRQAGGIHYSMGSFFSVP